MIVDDDEHFGRNAAEFLGLHGFNCLFSGRPVEGLAAAREFMPELAVIDFEMPELDGAGLAAGLLGIPGLGGLPLICLTAFPEGAADRLAAVCPSCLVLDKTDGLTGLLSAVNGILGTEK